jgi:hypothetical protein
MAKIKQQLVSGLLALWVVLWLLFPLLSWVRSKNSWVAYWRLAAVDFETRRKLVYGADFCHYIEFCQAKLPTGATFQFLGPDDDSVTRPRANLLLYPHLPSDRPDFILVYQAADLRALKDTELFATFNGGSFILRVVKSR